MTVSLVWFNGKVFIVDMRGRIARSIWNSLKQKETEYDCDRSMSRAEKWRVGRARDGDDKENRQERKYICNGRAIRIISWGEGNSWASGSLGWGSGKELRKVRIPPRTLTYGTGASDTEWAWGPACMWVC